MHEDTDSTNELPETIDVGGVAYRRVINDSAEELAVRAMRIADRWGISLAQAAWFIQCDDTHCSDRHKMPPLP